MIMSGRQGKQICLFKITLNYICLIDYVFYVTIRFVWMGIVSITNACH